MQENFMTELKSKRKHAVEAIIAIKITEITDLC